MSSSRSTPARFHGTSVSNIVGSATKRAKRIYEQIDNDTWEDLMNDAPRTKVGLKTNMLLQEAVIEKMKSALTDIHHAFALNETDLKAKLGAALNDVRKKRSEHKSTKQLEEAQTKIKELEKENMDLQLQVTKLEAVLEEQKEEPNITREQNSEFYKYLNKKSQHQDDQQQPTQTPVAKRGKIADHDTIKLGAKHQIPTNQTTVHSTQTLGMDYWNQKYPVDGSEDFLHLADLVVKSRKEFEAYQERTETYAIFENKLKGALKSI